MPPSSSPVPSDHIPLKFIFANNDGLSLVLSFAPSSTLESVKQTVISNWPQPLEPAPTVERLRMICMGRGMLGPDEKGVGGLGIPRFDDYPTPINCSIRPAGTQASGSTKKYALPSILQPRADSSSQRPTIRSTGESPSTSGGDQGDAMVNSRTCNCTIL